MPCEGPTRLALSAVRWLICHRVAMPQVAELPVDSLFPHLVVGRLKLSAGAGKAGLAGFTTRPNNMWWSVQLDADLLPQ